MGYIATSSDYYYLLESASSLKNIFLKSNQTLAVFCRKSSFATFV